MSGVPAQVIWSGGSQFNVVVPETVNAGALTVNCPDSPVWAFYGLAVAQAIPGIFTINGSGNGQGAVVNQDGTINAAGSAAARGTTVAVYATGLGSYQPASPDGLRRLAGIVTATIGGVTAPVSYAGQAPGTTLGVSQVNIQIPESLSAGSAVPVVLTVNELGTLAAVTLAVE
jgi:uncharacterized protein (TIGR03437 family)